MFTSLPGFLRPAVLLVIFLIALPLYAPAADLGSLLGNKELDETERTETIERIQNIQEKLKLLQDKLRVLERRKAAEKAAERAEGDLAGTPVQINWLPVDETTTDPGEFGLYTYLLFKGEVSDMSAIGALEDLILTIETLPEQDQPSGLANQFLVPVEKPQSLVSLGRQPYNFSLNEAFFRRLDLPDTLPPGPVLVSTSVPVDPYGFGESPACLAVALGRQSPAKSAELAALWHRQVKDPVSAADPLRELFWQTLDGAGTTIVIRSRQNIVVSLPQ